MCHQVTRKHFAKSLAAPLAALVAVAAIPAFAEWRPGLLGGTIAKKSIDTTSMPATMEVCFSPEAGATKSSPPWAGNTTWVYSGQIFLEAGTWYFAENIDDAVYMTFNGFRGVLNNSSYNVATCTTGLVVETGWYPIEIRLFNSSGGAGPTVGSGWTETKGFGFKKGGSASTAGGDFTFPVDPGDGTLFRHDDGTGFCVFNADFSSAALSAGSYSGIVLAGHYPNDLSGATLVAYYGTSDGGEDPSAWDASAAVAVAADGTNCTASLPSLPADASYFFRVAKTEGGSTYWSNKMAFTTATCSVELVNDGDELTFAPVVFRVSRPASAARSDLSLFLAQTGGTAEEGVDYAAFDKTIVFYGDETEKIVSLTPIFNPDKDANTSVTLSLNALNGPVAPAGATGVITNCHVEAGYNVWVATADGKASVPSNWSLGRVPNAADNILLSSDYSQCAMTWDAGVNGLSDTVASWRQVGYGNTVTFQTLYGATGFTNFVVTGDCVVSNGCWTHLANSSAATYRLRATIGGKMTIGPEAVIHADGKGYLKTGPAGYKLLSNRGGTHGGQGSNNAQANPICYGSIASPEDLGGGSANDTVRGGGAIRLEIGGALVLDGTVRAKPTNPPTWHVPAGGSVWITAGSISGAGSVSADSGYTSNSYWGGGGRVSLCLTGEGADFSAFTGKATAYGARKGSATGAIQNAPGTVYYETAADGRGGGTIVVDAGGFTCGSFYTTDIYLADQPGLHPKSIQSRNGAYVRIYGNGTAGDLSLVVGESVALSNTTTLVVQNGAVLDISSATLGGLGATSGTRTLSIADGELRTSGALAHTNMVVTFQQPESLLTPANLAIRPATNGIVRFNSTRDLGSSPVTILDGGTLVANYPVTMAGNLVVKAGGLVTHDANRGDPAYALDIATTGNVTVEAGGAIDVNGKGFMKQSGPGASPTNGIGPNHGGRGVNNAGTGDARFVCYGSISSPTTLGSGHSNNDYCGGGALHLDIAGALVNDGLISADGNRNAGSGYPTAGGSVWITAGTMGGSGDFTANAAKRTTDYGNSFAGGGRVSLTVTNENADLSGLTGAITAYGAGSRTGRNGGAGTVYLRTAAQAPDEGTLIIDNGLTSTKSSSAPTELSSTVLDKEVGTVIIRDRAQLALFSDNALTVNGSWTNAATFVAQDASTVAFAGDANADIVGDTAFANLVCTTPGKKLVFASGSTTTVAADGVLQFAGTGEAPVVLRASEPGTAWNLVADATVAQSVENVDVADSDASSGATITAINGVGANTVNWTFVTAYPGQLLTWTGAESSAWGVGANWDAGRAPITTDRILIPAGTPHSPSLQVATTIAELTVNSDARLSLGGLDLTVTGDASIAGTVAASAAETLAVGGALSLAGDYTGSEQALVLNGTAAQTASFSSDAIYSVRLANASADGVTVSGALATSYLACETAEATAIRFDSGASVSATLGLVLKGTAATPNLTLAPARSGTWSIKAPVRADVSGVVVSGGDASSGATIYAPDSTDGGGNANWVFAAHEYAQWTGAVDSDFHTADNWASGEVPGATDDVLVDGAATITASSAVSVNSIVLGGTGASATFTATAPVDVAKDVVVGDGGTLSLNRPSTVTGSVILENGATMTHEKNGSTEVNKLTLAVGGDMLVSEGAVIDVTGKGYGDKAKGPGATTATAGASYGGRAPSHNHTGLHCYGSIFCPTNLGSSGNHDYAAQRAGGGAVRLVVAGTLRMEGKILANGAPHTSQNYFSGSGGSIYLTVRQLLGSGTINANGGNYLTDYQGGGGRIALYLAGKGAAPADFDGIIGAYSGYCTTDALRKPNGSCGTVYYQTASQRPGKGEVVLDGGANSTGTSSNSGNPGRETRTEYPVTIQADLKEGSTAVWRLRRFARLYLTSDATVEDIFLEGSTPQIDLNGHVLTVRSRQHALGANEAAQVIKGGEVIWLPRGNGTMFRLR